MNRASLDQNIHNVRTIFSECINDNVDIMLVKVLDKGSLKQHHFSFESSNSIYVNLNSENQVLVFSWPGYHQSDENKWNNFLLQLEENHNLGFIGTGPFEFEYKGFNYNVYPPAFSFSQTKVLSSQSEGHTFLEAKISDKYESYEPSAFSFSQKEANQIIENIKRSHQSIKKQVIDHYTSLNKDFVENDVHSVKIIADVNNKTKLTSIRCSNTFKDITLESEESEIKYETTLLHTLVKLGDKLLPNVKALLTEGADVNAMDESKRTPLHYAAKNNNEEIVVALIKAGANVNAVDKDGKTPLGLTTNEEIKALLKKAAEKPDDGSVDEPSKDSEGDSEEEQGGTGSGIIQEEEEVVEDNLGPDVIKKENSDEESQRKQDISGEKGTDEKTGSAQPVAPTESNAPIQRGDVQGTTSTGEKGTAAPTQNNESTNSAAQTEEQPSSFFGSLFSILMKPFSLIASFFGGFFSWLFGSDTDESTSQTDARCEGESSSCDYDATRIDE